MTQAELAAVLEAARSRLEPLALYRRPIRRDVRVVTWPWLFELPPMRRYVAYAFIRTIALRSTPDAIVARSGRDALERLLVHEMCHIWQFQHHPVKMTLALLRYRYRDNPFEREARRAANAA